MEVSSLDLMEDYLTDRTKNTEHFVQTRENNLDRLSITGWYYLDLPNHIKRKHIQFGIIKQRMRVNR